jgi:hypothetical protein
MLSIIGAIQNSTVFRLSWIAAQLHPMPTTAKKCRAECLIKPDRFCNYVKLQLAQPFADGVFRLAAARLPQATIRLRRR